MISQGDLVYYDKCGGIFQMSFPFSDPGAEGLAVVVSGLNQYTDVEGSVVHWVTVLVEDGTMKKIAVDYLRTAN